MLNYNSSSFITSGGEGNMIITRGYQAKNTTKQNKTKGMPDNYRDMYSLFT